MPHDRMVADDAALEQTLAVKPRGRRVLLLLLNVVGNLAVGVGLCVGYLVWTGNFAGHVPSEEHQATQTADAEPSADAKSVSHPPADPTPAAPSVPEPVQRIDSVSVADSLLLTGKLEQALQAYEQLSETATEAESASLLYRKSLCLEQLGRHADAMNGYSVLIGDGSGPSRADVGQLGQARCFQAQGRNGPARDALYSLLLTSGNRPEFQAATLHQLARLLTLEVDPNEQDLLDDRALLSRLSERKPLEVLTELLELYEPPVADLGQKPTATGFRVRDRFGERPESVQVDIQIGSINVLDLLELIRANTSWELSGESAPILRSRMISLNVNDMNLAAVLDACLDSTETVWDFRDGQIVLSAKADDKGGQGRDRRLAQAKRILQVATAKYADDADALRTFHCLGNVSFWRGEYDEALTAYGELDQRAEERETIAAAAFNRVKTYLRQGQRDLARETLLRVVDAARGNSLEPVAYLYLGRLYLEEHSVDNATKHLARGLSLARTDEIRRVGAVTLASAYLLGNNPQAANQTLVDHRDALRVEPQESQAAFTSALARFRASTGDSNRVRRQRELTNALANVEPSRFFGSIGYVLVGQANAELGLVDQMEQTYIDGVAATHDHPLRTDMMLSLANYLTESGRWSEAEGWYLRFSESGSDESLRTSMMGRAEISYRAKRDDECIARCYELLTLSPTIEEKATALRLMGKVFERQGQHYKAALCFAGMVPTVPANTP